MISQKVTRAVNSLPEKFGEAWLSCVVAMTQGDLDSLTWKHVVVAYNTGIKTAITYAICCLLLRRISAFGAIALTGVLTSFADLVTHPTHFGSAWSEAVATGFGASFLALIFHLVVVKISRKGYQYDSVKRSRNKPH